MHSSASLSAGDKTDYGQFCLLGTQDVRAGDDICLKRLENAFWIPSRVKDLNKKNLATSLREDGVETLVITGLSSTEWVVSTVKGAPLSGFNCVVVSDLLADDRGEERDETIGIAPACHERLLKRYLGSKRSRSVIFTTRDQLLPVL